MGRRQAAAFAVVLSTGFLFGSTVISIPVTLNYHTVLSDCTRLNTVEDCEFYHACMWAEGQCGYRDLLGVTPEARCQNMSATKAGCDGNCAWDESDHECRHLPGWSPAQVGLFVSAHIVGGTISTLLGAPIIAKLFSGNIRAAGVSVGLVSAVGTALVLAGWVQDGSAVGVLPLILVGRFLCGFAYGLGAVVGPLHGAALSSPERRMTVGILFGPAIAFGNMAMSALALGVNPSKLPAQSAIKLFPAVNALHLVNCAAVVFSFLVAPSVPKEEQARVDNHLLDDAQPTTVQPLVNAGSDGTAASAIAAAAVSFKFRVAVGVVMATALQSTGVTAVFAFAPKLAESAGLSPLLGNFILMAFNALCTVGAVPTAKRFSCRTMFLVSALGASVSCLVTAVPTLILAFNDPAGGGRTALDAVIFIGVLAVLGTYELGMGSSFYVLAQQLFQPHERRVGNTITVGWAFFMVFVISGCYSSAQSLLSGDGLHGNAGNELRGQGIIFLMFGIAGLCCCAFLFKHLHPVSE